MLKDNKENVTFTKVVKLGKLYKPIEDIHVQDILPPGVYELQTNLAKELFFSSIDTVYDSLIDLPNTEYDMVVKEIDSFIKPETKQIFKQEGYLYKRGALLHGLPGTGKTCIINRVTEKVIKDGGVVLFSPNPGLLHQAFNVLTSMQPETMVMVVFEELDELLKHYESDLLNLLDGEIQKDNVIFMATTNYIEKIPARIRRPGRFSSIIEVKFPSKETRSFYLHKKLSGYSEKDLSQWILKTDGFSIDELKETVVAVKCLGYPLDEIIERIRNNKHDRDYVSYMERTEEYEEFSEESDTDNYSLTFKKSKYDR